MNTDHPTDWALRYVKAQALREAVDEFARTAPEWSYGHLAAVEWFNARADELERR